MAGRPNVVIITTHDSGTHFGCYGAGGVCTPSIDALASEGVRFDRMFSPSSMCSPSRGALLTGQWPERNGLLGLSGPKWRYELADKRRHLSWVLRGDGYRTALYGFQHEAACDGDLGFDTVYPLEAGGSRRSALEIAEAAAGFLRSPTARERPFYLQIGFFESHTPYLWGGLEPDRLGGIWLPQYCGVGEADPGLADHIAAFQGSINRVDRAVGILTGALAAGGLDEDTLVVFTTDHGAEMPRAKWTMYDAGLRVAFIMRWPGGGIGAGTVCSSLLGNVDFLPTLARLIRVEVPHGLDGTSFAGLLWGEGGNPVRRSMYHSFVYGMNWAVRTDRCKLVRNFRGTMFNARRFREGSSVPAVQLYDLESDPLETRDVSAEPAYREVREEHEDLLWSYLVDVDSPVLHGHIVHPPGRELLEELRSTHGEMGRVDPGLEVTRTEEQPGKYRIDAEGYRLEVDFGANYGPRAVCLYDLEADPACEHSLAAERDHAARVANLKSQLFGLLRAGKDPVLRRLEPGAVHAACLEEYRKWRRRREERT